MNFGLKTIKIKHEVVLRNPNATAIPEPEPNPVLPDLRSLIGGEPMERIYRRQVLCRKCKKEPESIETQGFDAGRRVISAACHCHGEVAIITICCDQIWSEMRFDIFDGPLEVYNVNSRLKLSDLKPAAPEPPESTSSFETKMTRKKEKPSPAKGEGRVIDVEMEVQKPGEWSISPI